MVLRGGHHRNVMTVAERQHADLRPEQTFLKEVKGSKLSGVKLLGNNLKVEEMIQDFLTAVDKERKNKTRKVREWDKPLIIDVRSFGVSQ